MPCPKDLDVLCVDDPELLRAYVHDASPLEGEVPEAAFFPATSEEVAKVLKWAYDRNVAVYPFGGGSSLVGSPLPFEGVILDTSLLLDFEVYSKDKLVLAGAGWVLKELNERLGEYGLWFPVDPGSVDMATVGGVIATNAGGLRAVKYGLTCDNVRALEFVTADGRIIWSGSWAKKSSTWLRVHQLLVGSEGTLGVVTKALLTLRRKPERKRSVMIQFNDMRELSEAVSEVLDLGPSALEMLDERTIAAINSHPLAPLKLEERPTLLVEFDESPEERLREVKALGLDFLDAPDEDLWAYRRLAGPSLTRVKGSRSDWDVAVPITKIPDAVSYVYENAGEWDVAVFGHVGDGNLHINFLHPPGAEWVEKAIEKARELVCGMTKRFRATVSGEHGIGLLKLAMLGCEVNSEALELWRALKSVFDPKGLLNPGKKVPL